MKILEDINNQTRKILKILIYNINNQITTLNNNNKNNKKNNF